MNKMLKVLKFEYLSYVKNKSYIITTILISLIIIIALSIPLITPIFSKDDKPDTDTSTVGDGEPLLAGIIDSDNLYDDDTLQSFFPDYKWEHLDDLSQDEIDDLVKDEYQMILSVDGLKYSLTEKSADNMYSFSMSQQIVDDMIVRTNQLQLLEKNKLSADTAIETLDMQADGLYTTVGKNAESGFWLGYILLFVLYFTIVMYGQFVMSSVITEKTSKAMELLLTSVKPLHLMFGKVFGVGLAGLTQIGAFILSAIVMLIINAQAWQSFSPMIAEMINIKSIAPSLIYLIIFFILGFFAFAFLYAAFASTVSRMEDASSVTILPMMLFMAAFFVAMFSLTNPQATHVLICSFVPFLSPMVMFMRIVASSVAIPLYQIVISIIINMITVFFAGVFASRVYRTYAMMYGQKPKLGQILKYVFSSR